MIFKDEFAKFDGPVIEMHAHTSDKSLDSGVSAIKMIPRAKEKGLSGICLTEHNAIWDSKDISELSDKFEINVFSGMELGTDIGHVLAYGFKSYRPQLLMIDNLLRAAEEEGAALVLAHPMRSTGSDRKPSIVEMGEWFDALEVVNGDHSDSTDGYYLRLASQLGVGAIGGSDAHSLQAIGRVATVFGQSVNDQDALVRGLLEQNVHPIDFR